jgi:mRNA-degrading endonuclease RelE of RelBE toxin-antitoxin system
MADSVSKFLKLLSKKDKMMLIEIIENILQNNIDTYDLKRLVGVKDIYRIRKGKYRIIFKKTSDTTHILEIERRSESTYREY